LIILLLFFLVFRSLNAIKPAVDRYRTSYCMFGLLTLASLGHTWFYMLKFLAWSFNDYEANRTTPTSDLTVLTRLTSWLLYTSLFEQAWSTVCFGPLNWWWSQQLCLYTVGAWTVFLATKGRIYRIPHIWAYMVLGQLVAISVATNLFYLAVLLASAKQTQKSTKNDSSNLSAAPSLYVPIFLGLYSVFRSPNTSSTDSSFIINLLCMHTLLVVPLVLPPISVPLLPAIPMKTFSLAIASLSIMLHVRWTFLLAFREELGVMSFLLSFPLRAWETLQRFHPAQSSIGWDVVWTTISLVVWSLLDCSSCVSGLTLAVTPVLSAGGVAPFVFGFNDTIDVGRDIKAK